MKRLLALLCCAVSLNGFAQSQARPLPPGSTVIDNVLPPPVVKEYKEDPRAIQAARDAAKDAKAKPEPTVTTRKSGDDTIQEYRLGGKLYKQRIQPASGAAYYLVDDKGEGKWTRVDGPDVKIAVPTWVLLEW